MNKLQLTGVALAVGAASMFALAPAFAAEEASTTTTTTVQCKGDKVCQGNSACKDNMVEMTKEQCEKEGGEVVEQKDMMPAE